jgi:hypothetical protein
VDEGRATAAAGLALGIGEGMVARWPAASAQPIAGWRLATAAAVQTKPALQFRDTAGQRRSQFLLRLDFCALRCDDLPRRRNGDRSSIVSGPGLAVRSRRHGRA